MIWVKRVEVESLVLVEGFEKEEDFPLSCDSEGELRVLWETLVESSPNLALVSSNFMFILSLNLMCFEYFLKDGMG